MRNWWFDAPVHPLADKFPMLDKDELAVLADDIRDCGLMQQLVYSRTNGHAVLVDGRNRLAAIRLLGRQPTIEEVTERQFADELESMRWIISVNVKRRHLSAGQRAMLALNLMGPLEAAAKKRQADKANLPEVKKGQARDEAARLVGVSGRSVQTARAILRSQPELAEKVLRGEATLNQAHEAVKGAQSRSVLHSSESNEWYTPPEYVQFARAVMGNIELDPASSDEANETIRAAHYLTVEQDGMAAPWFGSVWLNPPYGGSQGEWLDKLLEEYDAGRVLEACILVNAVPDCNWWQPLWDWPMIWFSHRIPFLAPGGRQGRQPTHASVLAYLPPQRNELELTERLMRFYENGQNLDGRVSMPDRFARRVQAQSKTVDMMVVFDRVEGAGRTSGTTSRPASRMGKT